MFYDWQHIDVDVAALFNLRLTLLKPTYIYLFKSMRIKVARIINASLTSIEIYILIMYLFSHLTNGVSLIFEGF